MDEIIVNLDEIIEQIDLAIEAYDAIEGPVDRLEELGWVSENLKNWSIDD